MIIKSHIRGGYRAAADYLKEQGKNEKIRLVQISDPDANNLDEAFHNMWQVASTTHATKPLHHISINPMKDERLTDRQVQKIVERCEQKYGYKPEQQSQNQRNHQDHCRRFHIGYSYAAGNASKIFHPRNNPSSAKTVSRNCSKP